VTFEAGEYLESEIIQLLTQQVYIAVDQYNTGSGDPITIKYKNGNSEANCNADTWNTYSVPFNSLGFIKIRMEV